MQILKHVQIYTDGACRGNPGPGGFGAVLLYGDRRRELSKGYRWTTNNRMEIRGLLEAVRALNQPCAISIHSDSKYLLNAFQKNWLRIWKQNGWKTKTQEAVLNRDIWEELDALIGPHTPTFHWVKGHASNAENNRCDELAVKAAAAKSLEIDLGYERIYPYRKKAEGAIRK